MSQAIRQSIGPTFAQSLWTHAAEFQTGPMVRVFDEHPDPYGHLEKSWEEVEHYGKREYCAKCRMEKRNMADFENWLTGRGLIVLVVLPIMGAIAALLVYAHMK